MDQALTADERVELVLQQMTLDEKLGLLHGNGMPHTENWRMPLSDLGNGGAGYAPGVARLGIPPIVMSDAAYGVQNSGSTTNRRVDGCFFREATAYSSGDPQQTSCCLITLSESA